MIWIRGYLGTVGMAGLLAMLTWVWLYSESTATPRAIDFEFQPKFNTELASVDYDGLFSKNPHRVRVTVTGRRSIVETLRPGFAIVAVIPNEAFSQEKGTYVLHLQREHFPLQADVQITDLPKDIQIHYVRYVERTVALVMPITSDPAPPGYRVADIRPTPTEIRVRLPADQVGLLGPKLNVQKVPLRGQTSSFGTPGYLQLPSPDMKQIDDLRLEVVVEPDLVPLAVKGVPLNMSGPPKLRQRLAFKTDTPVEVLVEGPSQQLNELKPEDLHAYVRVDHLTENDLKTPPIVLKEPYFGCEVINPKFRGIVRVKAVMSEAAPDNRQVEIVVLPEK